MKMNYSKYLRKLASLAYSAGVVSLIIGVLLSVVNQPVSAYTQSTGGRDHKIWICHVTPGNAVAINVDENGWNGHDDHNADFQISGPNDPNCKVEDEPTKTPKPTKTQEPTKTSKPTKTSVPTETTEPSETTEPTVE